MRGQVRSAAACSFKIQMQIQKNEMWGYCNVLPRFSRHCQDSQSRLTFVGHSLKGGFICLSRYKYRGIHVYVKCLLTL